MSLCVVIPAAGRGSRLGIDVPKILAPVTETLTVWDVLRARSERVADHVHVVLAPHAIDSFTARAWNDFDAGRASYSIQPEPLGMGDAVFRAAETFSRYDAMIVMWGDQLGIRAETLSQVADALRAATSPTLVLPLATTPNPYVEYQFDARGAVESVLQSREGDAMSPVGPSDVGVFGLTTAGLVDAWTAYAALGIVGAKTREANFLPFLPYLAQKRGYRTVRIDGVHPDEARGLNTKDDLAYFQERFRQGERP